MESFTPSENFTYDGIPIKRDAQVAFTGVVRTNIKYAKLARRHVFQLTDNIRFSLPEETLFFNDSEFGIWLESFVMEKSARVKIGEQEHTLNPEVSDDKLTVRIERKQSQGRDQLILSVARSDTAVAIPENTEVIVE